VNWCLVQLGFFSFIMCRIILFSAIICNTSSFLKDQSNWSALSFCNTTFQNVLSISDLFFGTVQFAAPHNAMIQTLKSTVLVLSLNLTPRFWSRCHLVECCFCGSNDGFKFIRKFCIFCHHSTEYNIQIFRWLLMGKLSLWFNEIK
jgi:hypothetical protein